MKNVFLLLGLCLSVLATRAQNSPNPVRFTLQAVVTDTTTKPLSGATVMLLNPKDSALVNFTRTVETGAVSLKNVKKGTYILKITYVGLVPYDRPITFENDATVDLGTIKLKPIAKELMEVVIRAARAPLTIRGDTVEYNASSFKVPPGSTVEDLLRKLPGVLVDQEGNIRAQGQEVKKVTVDGKNFFGNDPKQATKNLAAEAISKVQIFNDKTEQAKLTGVDDGTKEKTVNLQLKDEFKKGGFGKITAGGGSDLVPAPTQNKGRFEATGNYNKFDDKQQISVIGLGNNTNKTGLSFNDYQDFRGSNSFNWNDNADFGFSSSDRFLRFGGEDDENLGIPIGGGGGRGFSTNAAGGINYNYDTKPTKISTSYYYSQTRLALGADRNRRNFLESGSYRTAETSNQVNFNSNHRVSLRVEKTIDSLNTLVFINNTRLNNGTASLNSQQNLFNTTDVLATQNATNNSSTSRQFGSANSLLYRLKFKKKGRNLAASATYQINTNNGDLLLNAQNQFFQATTVNDMIRALRQDQATRSDRSQYKASLLFVEPFAKKFYWETFYNFNLRFDKIDRNVSDLVGFEYPLTPLRNDSLSRYYKNNYRFNRLGSSVRYSFKGLNLSAGLAGQQFTIDGRFASRPESSTSTPINRTFTTLIPNVSLNYDMKNNKFLSASYNKGVQIPSSRDLLPIIDNSNPLFVREGNPNLLPELQHTVEMGFSYFNPGNFTNLFINVSGSYYQNQIVYSQFVDTQRLITRTLPENLSGGKTIGSYASFGFPLKKTKAVLNVNTNINIGNNPTNINGIRNQTNNQSYNLGARLDLTPTEWFTFYANANVGISQTRYSLNAAQNQTIYNNTFNGDMNLKLPGGFFFSTNLNYRIYRNANLGFNQRVPIWNASAYKLLGKAQKMEVRLSAFDMLNRNVSVSQYAGQNYVSEERIRSLARYFLLSFTYNMRGVKAKMRQEDFY